MERGRNQFLRVPKRMRNEKRRYKNRDKERMRKRKCTICVFSVLSFFSFFVKKTNCKIEQSQYNKNTI